MHSLHRSVMACGLLLSLCFLTALVYRTGLNLNAYVIVGVSRNTAPFALAPNVGLLLCKKDIIDVLQYMKTGILECKGWA